MRKERGTHRAAVASLGHERQVGREGTGVAGTGGLLVGVRARHVVGELARALEHRALRVGAVLVLDLLGHRLGLVDRVRDADQVAPRDAVERVAGRAHLAVDLVATADPVGEGSRGAPRWGSGEDEEGEGGQGSVSARSERTAGVI